ncbi:MAG: type II secretion system protein [Phycisphaerales bacterium]|nr:type II secretion system protein [Phycisphaerales bacterium]MCB9854865.1 type II secretion system protein [Phycisphaerales bacterium]
MRFDNIKRSGTRGFTLLELLVVIAIIAVLISILVPALSKAKCEAGKAKCLSNLRSLSQFTHMYTEDQGANLIQWYTHPALRTRAPYSVYNPGNSIMTPFVFGGFLAPRPQRDPNNNQFNDTSRYPVEIRPLNKYVDPTARGEDTIGLYICPEDKTFDTPVIGTPGIDASGDTISSWQANGTSYGLNTRFMGGYAGNNGAWGNFGFNADGTPHDAYMRRIARHMTGGEASEFILWLEQGMYSASYGCAMSLQQYSAGLKPIKGWHCKFSQWSMAYADGHAGNGYYDTRLAYSSRGWLFEPYFDPNEPN